MQGSGIKPGIIILREGTDTSQVSAIVCFSENQNTINAIHFVVFEYGIYLQFVSFNREKLSWCQILMHVKQLQTLSRRLWDHEAWINSSLTDAKLLYQTMVQPS